MTPTTQEARTPVPPEEVARRITEMRGLAFRAKSKPIVVYHPPDQPCPWPGCGYRIGGIVFPLELMVPADELDKWLAAWWLGPGLIGKCPHCNRLVLFDVLSKQAVLDPAAVAAPLLPDDWYEKAHLATSRKG